MCTVCVRCLVTCMPQWARKGKYGREVSSSAPKCSKVSPSGIENKNRSHRSLKPVLLLFFKILLNLRKPSKPSFRPPFQTLDPIFAQQVAILPTRPDRSSVRSGSQKNMCTQCTATPNRLGFSTVSASTEALVTTTQEQSKRGTCKRAKWPERKLSKKNRHSENEQGVSNVNRTQFV